MPLPQFTRGLLDAAEVCWEAEPVSRVGQALCRMPSQFRVAFCVLARPDRVDARRGWRCDGVWLGARCLASGAVVVAARVAEMRRTDECGSVSLVGFYKTLLGFVNILWVRSDR